jgi:homocysteine S-methyltransferase
MGKFLDLIAEGRPVLLDGAGGTELERRGVPDNLRLWSGTGVREAPDVVVQIHRDNIRAGAQIITTQTFTAARRRFAKSGLADLAMPTAREAVKLAIRAREEEGRPDVLVAGSYSPLEQCYHPELAPDEATAYEEHLETVTALSEAGSDFLLAETFNTIHEARAALRAGKTTGLDVVVGFVCGRDGRLLSGEPVAQAVAELEPFEPAGYAINCTPIATTTRALADLRRAIDRPVGAYSNVGDWSIGTWSRVFGPQFIFDVSPEGYLHHATTWLELGASFAGGCCGTTPEHIAALTRRYGAAA